MLFNIPQFIDKEDKIVGPLTAKQLGWLAICGVLILVFFKFLDTTAFMISLVPTLAIFGALAFYRPNNQPLIFFIMSSVGFTMHPKMYVWRRIPEKIVMPKKAAAAKTEAPVAKKVLTENKIAEIAELLDQRH